MRRGVENSSYALRSSQSASSVLRSCNSTSMPDSRISPAIQDDATAEAPRAFSAGRPGSWAAYAFAKSRRAMPHGSISPCAPILVRTNRRACASHGMPSFLSHARNTSIPAYDDSQPSGSRVFTSPTTAPLRPPSYSTYRGCQRAGVFRPCIQNAKS